MLNNKRDQQERFDGGISKKIVICEGNFKKDIKSRIYVGKEIYKTAAQYRTSYTEVFLGKGVLTKCSKFTGENP